MSKERDQYSDECIGRLIREMPESTPPPWLASRVMANLEAKRPGVWERFRAWMTTPVSLTVSPARVAFASLLLVAALGVAGLMGTGMPGAGPGNADGLMPVSFVLKDPSMGFRSVSVIGSFNGWDARNNQMEYVPETGMWVFRTRLPAGDHEYVFLVDGEKVLQDPQSVLSRDDGFGNRNSVLLIKHESEQSL